MFRLQTEHSDRWSSWEYKEGDNINNIQENQNNKRFYVGFYSIDVDANRLVCENGEDFSGLMINPEILLSLGINRKDCVYLDEHGYWRRFPRYMEETMPGIKRLIDNRCVLYKKPIIIDAV